MNIKIAPQTEADVLGLVEREVLDRLGNQPADADAVQVTTARVVYELARTGQIQYTRGGGWRRDAQMMRDRVLPEIRESGYNPLRSKWKMLWAMPTKMADQLRLQNFDGRPDWENNPDVLKYLPKKPEFEFLKEFPLATEDPAKFGLKTKENNK